MHKTFISGVVSHMRQGLFFPLFFFFLFLDVVDEAVDDVDEELDIENIFDVVLNNFWTRQWMR
jgi:hypothetical protein